MALYLRLRQQLVNMGGSNQDDDDVLDAFVELTAEHEHFTDDELEMALRSYREYEKIFPDMVKKGNALRKVS